jgi:hypothetical protein
LTRVTSLIFKRRRRKKKTNKPTLSSSSSPSLKIVTAMRSSNPLVLFACLLGSVSAQQIFDIVRAPQ